MRAFLYIRVSDDEQVKDGFSIEAQEMLLRRKCKEWGYEVIGQPYVDDGYSAKNMKRPHFQRMLNDVERLRAQVIIFWRLDRFSRSSRDFQKVTEELEAKHCGIRSCTENIDTTTAMGRFQLELTISLGQLERETTAERVHFVMEERHRKGLRNGATAPYGYRLEDGNLFVVPEEAEIIREIFELYRKPHSTRAIAKLFNQDKIKYPSRRDGNWTDFTVQYILTNPVYCGKLRWNQRKAGGKRTYNEIVVDSIHEPIISVEEFETVQAIRHKRFVKREKVHSDYHFTGVLKCGRCGYGMIGLNQKYKQTNTAKRFYRCLGRANYGVCNMPNIREEVLVEAFLESLDVNSDHYKKFISISDVVPSENNYEQEAIKRDLENVQRRRKKWQEAFASEVITLDELRGHMEEERLKEDLLKKKLEPVEEIKINMSRTELMELLSSFRDLWHEIDDEMSKKQFIQYVFRDIVINSSVEKGVARPGKTIPVDIVSWQIND